MTWVARLCRVLFVAVALQAFGVGPSAAQQQSHDPSLEADMMSRAEVFRADAVTVRAAVARLGAAVAQQAARVAEAEAEADAAEAALTSARAQREGARARVQEHRERARRVAAAAYIRGPASVDLVLRSETINDAVRRHSIVAAAGEATADVLDASKRAEAAAEDAERAAAEAAVAAESAVAEARSAAAALADEERTQSILLAAISERLDHTLGEIAALRAVDAAAAESLSRRDDALASMPTPAAPPARRTHARALPPVETARVGQITIAATVAPNLERLLAAASAAGLSLGGSGYRDTNVQISLRVQNCGPADYDVYDKPAGECSPPTARPGTSMHERGLAVDFTSSGAAIVSDTDAAFAWLSANAPTYGFSNLSGEPWHWSTTGT